MGSPGPTLVVNRQSASRQTSTRPRSASIAGTSQSGQRASATTLDPIVASLATRGAPAQVVYVGRSKEDADRGGLMANVLRVTLEHRPKGRRAVAVAPDWLGSRVRHLTANHTMDHAWEMEDKDLMPVG